MQIKNSSYKTENTSLLRRTTSNKKNWYRIIYIKKIKVKIILDIVYDTRFQILLTRQLEFYSRCNSSTYFNLGKEFIVI